MNTNQKKCPLPSLVVTRKRAKKELEKLYQVGQTLLDDLSKQASTPKEYWSNYKAWEKGVIKKIQNIFNDGKVSYAETFDKAGTPIGIIINQANPAPEILEDYKRMLTIQLKVLQELINELPLIQEEATFCQRFKDFFSCLCTKSCCLLILALLFGFTTNLWAGNWMGNSYIIVNDTWYNGSGSGNKTPGNIGTIDKLVLNGQIQTFGDGSGSSHIVSFGYKIDGGSANYFNLSWTDYRSNNNWYGKDPDKSKAGTPTTVDLKSLKSGSHNFEVWFHSDAAWDNSLYDNNSGSNYKFTFTVSAYYVTGEAFSGWNNWTKMTKVSDTDYTATITTIGNNFKVSDYAGYDDDWYKALDWGKNVGVTVTPETKKNSNDNANVTLASGYTTPVVLHLNPSTKKMWAVATVKPTYSVTYSAPDKTSGNVPTDANTYEQNATVIVKGNTGSLAKTGYDFASWKHSINGYTYTANQTFTMGTANVTMTAQWTPKSYTITYKDQGDAAFSGTHETGYPTKHTYGTATTLKSASKSGYNFLGWYKESACTNKVTSLGATDYTSNITLYAKWESSATYSLVVAKGTGITAVSGGKSGQTTVPFDGGTISATMANGYDFDEWTADPAANATFADANSATTTVTVSNGSVTVTANAKAKSYNINYPSGTGYTITNNPATGATDATITFTVTPATKYSVVVKQDGNILTMGASNQYSFTMPAHDVNITVEVEYQSGWYVFGNNWDGWDDPATNAKKQFTKSYRGMQNVYYQVQTLNTGTYFRLIYKNGSNNPQYQLQSSSNYDLKDKKGQVLNLVGSGNDAIHTTQNFGEVWLIVKTTDTKKFAVIDPVSTFYTVSVSEPEDHSTALTLKDEAWDLKTDQYSANDTYVLKVTAASGYRAVLKVNGVATSWCSTAGGYTYKAKPSENTTLTVEYVQQYAVTHNYYSGCTATMGTYTVKAGDKTINSGDKVDTGTELTFAATPKPGYQFDGWYTAQTSGTKESELETYNKTINATTALYAKFSKKVWTVTVNTTTGGTTSPSGEQADVTQVDGLNINVTPEIGYYFVNWTKTAGEGSFTKDATTASNNFKPTSDATITAIFTRYNSSLPLSTSYHAGLIRVKPTLDEHYPQTITLCYELYKGDDKQDVEFDFGSYTDGTVTFPVAVAGTNYKLKAIVHGGSDCDATIIDEFEKTFKVEGIYTVNFAVSPADKGCSTDPASSNDNVKLNTPFDISASAGTGYHFNKWVATPAESFTFGTKEGDATDATTTATMTVETATSTITATFSPNTYSVHFNANCAEGTQQATGTMEDQSFEYDDAAKALTANAFVRLGYTFSGWSENASATEATYADKEAVQNLTTVNGGKVQLYAIWQLKEDCSITVIAPDAADGTIDPSAKVTGANVEGTPYTYTFKPKSGVTFMNWTITNAICVDGTNERSNPVKIKTYGDATIRANVKENLVSVTLKVVPNDQWGYFNVNGKNVASGTIINVGEKTTATVHGKNANFGYHFIRFEKSDDFDDLISYDESGVMKGKGGVGKVTLIAYFELDAATNWKLIGNWNTQGRSWEDGNEFRKHDDQVTKKIAYTSLTLNGGDYQFKIKKPDGTIMGLSDEGEMNETYHFGWTLNNTSGNSKVFKFKPSQNSTYTFRLDYTDENNPTVTLLYQNHWFPKNTTVYFNNHNENDWGRSIIRFGCDGGMAEAYDMTLVPGTANLYSYKFPQGYEYFEKYHIVNNYGWTGAKDKTNETTYGIYNIGEGDYKIGRSTEHMTDANSPGCVIRIKTDHYPGTYKVEYYKYDYWNSLESSRYTVNFTAPNAEQGTLTVEQWDNNEGSARTTLSSGAKVDQSRWITITATPATGYKFVKMTAKTQDNKIEDHFETTWKYAVQQNITSLTATFAPVQTYTFYVKNVVSSDTKWHNGGTKDVYLYYDNGKSDAAKVAYWGWPGLMATPMDNNHEWYKVEMTNAYFDIDHWRLNNGVGPNCPQTDQYVTQNGAPVFNGESMEDKYYELVYDQRGSSYETYKLQVASPVPDFYRVITNDNKYTSNVATVGEKVSFFATTDGAKLQKSSNSGWTDVTTISISKDTVWVATVGASGVTDLEHYSGNYYIRTDGADGGWNDYKKAGKNNTMTHFTKRTGETYSYYWVDNLGKEAAINVKAKIANDYNDNLAVEITNDANTNIYGNIEQLTNGSNVRFSYEPATNEFKRAILSGSAEASYLNIVAVNNIYSDISCKDAFKLDENTYKTNPSACKLTDISDWVYEKIVYAKVPNNHTNVIVDMYSMYNGNRSTLLDDKVIMASGTTEDTYKLRIIYDFKKNRITTAWSPSSQEIANDIVVNSDIMFLQAEKGDVSQITLSQTNNPNVKSLEYLLYVLEIEDPGEGKRKEEHYRISLPFDCRVSDIFGIEGYMDKWGIQKYNGELRAQQGWYTDSPVQNFWTWLKADEIMEAGRGYSVSIDKRALSWSSIGEEVTRTVCDAQGMNCQDVTTMEDRASHRLYFPSMNPGFDLKNSTATPETYKELKCNKTKANRDIYDSDWRFIGTKAYNNIKTTAVDNKHACELAPRYIWVLNQAETEYITIDTEEDFIYHSFGAYMLQFHGTIEWNIYTQSADEQKLTPRKKATEETKMTSMRLDLMEEDEQQAYAFVDLNEYGTLGFDQKRDLTNLPSSKLARLATVANDVEYSGNCLPYESQIVPVTVATLHKGDYTFTAGIKPNVAVYLIDYQEKTEIDLQTTNYTVELPKGKTADRFALRFDIERTIATDLQSGKGNMNDAQTGLYKFIQNDHLYIMRDGKLYDGVGTSVK